MIQRLIDTPNMLKDIGRYVDPVTVNWLRRSGHFQAGRLERPGGLLLQPNRLAMASAIIEGERGLIQAKEAAERRKKAKVKPRGR